MEIHKSQQDNIQYHAAIRRQVDRENLRAERTRLQGLLSKSGGSCYTAGDTGQIRGADESSQVK